MTRHTSDSPASDERLRLLIGAACFSRAAGHVGDWNPARLGRRLHTAWAPLAWGQDVAALDVRLDSAVRQFAFMLEGRRPGDRQLDRMARAVGLSSWQLARWRDHPLWSLLTCAVRADAVNAALDRLHGRYRRSVFDDDIVTPGWIHPRSDLHVDDARRLRKLGGMQGMLTLVALAREAQYVRNVLRRFWTACESRCLFPKWVATTPALYLRWRLLAMVMMERVWVCPMRAGSVRWFHPRLSELDAEVARVARRSRRRGLRLPPEATVETPEGWAEVVEPCVSVVPPYLARRWSAAPDLLPA